MLQNSILTESARKVTRLRVVAVLAILTILLVFLGGAAAQDDVVIPTFTIERVLVDESVAILAQNFPPFQDFVVTMGKSGTLGIGGIPVGVTNSGFAGAFSAAYPIPPELRGERQIAIRLQSPQGYFSYNWFWNNLAQPAPTPIPVFQIESVVVNESVTIRTRNFPPGRTFVVTMGHMGTHGIDGIAVGTLNSGIGGTITATYPIPQELKGLERIAIRTQSLPFFSYNWFNNQPLEVIQTPTFRICGVNRDDLVIIRTNPTFPPNRNFVVMMNFMGTLGTNGTVVGTFNSGPTGVITAAFPIPSAMWGQDRIAIRAEQVGGPFFSYNYFDNLTAIYCSS
jgi:hypothetical protein